MRWASAPFTGCSLDRNMSIRREYIKYLEHLGSTVPVVVLAHDRDRSNIVALRHDVDHDLDLALELAFFEQQHGARASYYLLHTAGYWQDPRLIDKCLQLQDLGHEVGLHFNFLTEWLAARVQNIGTALREIIAPLKEAGVKIHGVSTHGDPACYEKGFINYWCFSELRPEDPRTTERDRNAEGILDSGATRRIDYPNAHSLTRSDGSKLDLWSVSLRDAGFDYEALHIPFDRYYSDSGGHWRYTGDPLEQTCDEGRIQVLMHPVHWRGPQRLYLFLSCARSGSKWLANIIDVASPLTSRHELTLNHRFENERLVP